VVWDLTSLLGITGHCGELADSATTLVPDTVRELITQGLRVRRLLIDEGGHLLDLTPTSWPLGDADRSPYLLDLVIPGWLHTALTTGDLPGLTADRRELLDQVHDALRVADPALRATLDALLTTPITAEHLDDQPDADTPSPALAEFACVYAGHPANPTAGPTPPSAGDLDHHTPRTHGGHTIRANLAPITRRWHILKTHGGWTITRLPTGSWQWTSPTGHHHTVEPHDYRLGP
jgi:hypothetical protein